MAEQFRDTITIKFDAKGDQVLVKTIKSLDKATKSLIKAQSSLAGEGKKKIGVDKANLNSLRKLNIELKLQGKNLKAVGLDTNLYSQALKGNKLSMAKIRAATKKYNLDLKKTRKGLLDTAHSTRILGGSFAVLRSKLLIASFAMMLVERTVISLVKTFAKQEAVNQKLRAGLANIADTTEGVTQRLIDYSSALQKTTSFGDELITNGMTQLTTFGLNEKAIKSLTPQVLNVARAIQTTSGQMPDLNSLFIAFGKSTSTAVSALTRYGVVLTDAEKAQLESMGANKRATAIAKILDKQYGGLAEAYAQTTMGMLEGAEAARGDAAEAFGEVLAPAVLAVSQALKAMAEAVTPEHIKAYGTGFSVAALGAGLLAVKIKDVRKAMQALQALAVKNWVAALVAVLGIGVGVALDYFDVFEDGNDTLTDAEKRLKALKEAIIEDAEAQKALAEAQKDGAVSLQQQLDLLNATSEVVKMHINLGREASELETILIRKIVEKKQSIEDEKKAREESLETYKKYLEAMRDEVKLRMTLSQKIELAHLDLLQERFKSMSLDGKLTESNSEKLSQYIDFQKQLISTFGVGIHTTKSLTDSGIANGLALDMQSMNVQNLSIQEKSLLQVMIDIFNQKQKNIEQGKEELSLREQLIGSLSEEQLIQQELQRIEIEKAELIVNAVTNATSAIKENFNQRMQNEIDTLKKTSAYKNADAERRQDMEDKIARNYAKRQKAIFLIEKASKLADVYFNTASAVMKSIAISPLTGGQPWAGIAQILGGIQAAAILSTPAPQAFAKGGDFVTNKPELIMVGEAGREHVKITPVDRPEERALGGGGVTVNIMGGIIQDDYVRNELIPAINKAKALA